MVAAVTQAHAYTQRVRTSFPIELRERVQWVCWRREERDGKPTKVPYNARTGTLASTTEQNTWSACETALRACDDGTYDGVGYVLAADDPYTGVDLDHCRDPLTGEIAPAPLAALQAFASYAEISPSSDGVHVWVRARVARTFLSEGADGCKRGGFEAYSGRHFLTVTGQRLTSTPATVADAQPALDAFCAAHFGPKKTEKTTGNAGGITPGNGAPSASDTDLLTRARNHPKTGARFCALFDRGDLADYGGDHSAGDQALCNLLAYWCGPAREERIDSLFRQSQLLREKWERADYRARTIKNALDGRTAFYAWPDSANGSTHKLAAELAAVKAELARTRAELLREQAARVVSDRLVMHLRREQVAEDRILRQEETNDGDKVALIAFRRHMDRKNSPEKREPDGSLLVCRGGTDETTGRAYGLGALIGRSADVAGERARRLAGMGAWEYTRHDNWNGQFGVSRVTMRETWTGTHRPWTIVPTETTTRGKHGGKRVRICQNPLCRSLHLELVCTTCGTPQDDDHAVYVDEAEANAARQPQSGNSMPGRQLDPPVGMASTSGQVTPVWGTEEESGNLPPADCLDDSLCSVVGCAGELECYDAAGVAFCAEHDPQREAG
jgi:putative DNA primase/helicase